MALIVRLPLLFNDFSDSTTPDSPQLIFIANALLDGKGFETSAYRTPGYPLFIAPLTFLPGSTTSAVVLVQHALGIALVGAIFLVGDRYFGRVAAIFAATLTALAPPLVLVEHYVLPDLLFSVVLFAGAVMLIEAALSWPQSSRALVLVGVLFGFATYVKPTGQVLILAAPLVLAFATRSWRDTLRGSAIVAGAMAALVVPWVVHNAIKYGEPTVSIQGGQALWLRVFDQDKLPIPTDSPEGRLAKGLYDDYLVNPPVGYMRHPEALTTTESYSYVLNELGERGYSLPEITDIQGDLALEAIKSHPRAYLDGTIRNLKQYVRYNAGAHGFPDAEFATRQDVASAEASLRPLATGGWKVAGVLSRAGFVLSLSLLAVLLLPFLGSRRARTAAVGLMVVWAGVAVGGSLTNYVVPRFPAQIAPLQWLLEAAAVVLVVSAVVEFVRRQRGEPG